MLVKHIILFIFQHRHCSGDCGGRQWQVLHSHGPPWLQPILVQAALLRKEEWEWGLSGNCSRELPLCVLL